MDDPDGPLVRRAQKGDRWAFEQDCPNCGGELGEARNFNLMFKTHVGALEEGDELRVVEDRVVHRVPVHRRGEGVSCGHALPRRSQRGVAGGQLRQVAAPSQQRRHEALVPGQDADLGGVAADDRLAHWRRLLRPGLRLAHLGAVADRRQRSILRTGDKAWIEGHFYSVKSPGVAGLSLPVFPASAVEEPTGAVDSYLVAFGDIQQQVVLAVPGPMRVVVYRRLMLRIAEHIGRRAGAQALVTGEVVGQVASQTLDNMTVISAATSMPVLRPLIGMDKEEITAEAIRLGTFPTSIIRDEDCCTLFTPKHPATKASASEISGTPRISSM